MTVARSTLKISSFLTSATRGSVLLVSAYSRACYNCDVRSTMSALSLYGICFVKVCEYVSTTCSYSDIINNLWGEIPEPVLNDIVKHYITNCLVVDIDYISIVPTYDNCYKERICTECYSVINEPSFVNIRINVQKLVWERIKNEYECDQCGGTLATNIENSIE